MCQKPQLLILINDSGKHNKGSYLLNMKNGFDSSMKLFKNLEMNDLIIFGNFESGVEAHPEASSCSPAAGRSCLLNAFLHCISGVFRYAVRLLG